jgi:hypothetical protein
VVVGTARAVHLSNNNRMPLLPCVNPVGHPTKSLCLLNHEAATGEWRLVKDMKLSCGRLGAIMRTGGQAPDALLCSSSVSDQGARGSRS